MYFRPRDDERHGCGSVKQYFYPSAKNIIIKLEQRACVCRVLCEMLTALFNSRTSHCLAGGGIRSPERRRVQHRENQYI